LLTSERLNVGEVAARIGYQSDAAFSKAFKRHFGYAPLTAKRAQADT
jgi:transcriptional regulator GlxA family with amidase domain